MKVAIIGAGASGLFLGNLLKLNNIDFTIFNNGKVGRKILASGNGRCNIGNTNLDSSKYHNNPLANKLIKNKDKVFNLFKEMKIYLKEDSEGRLYPISESSQSILNIFTKNINNIVDLKVEKIDKRNNKYVINDKYDGFDKVVIAAGSISSVEDTNIYNYLNNLDLKFNEFKPSLVGFIVKERVKAISGVRCKCNVSLYNDNKLIHSEDGEVIFKDDGISGICIMNLSSYYQHLNNINKPHIRIDLLKNNKYESLESVINPKLLEYINKNDIDPYNMVLSIKDTYGFKNSQVSKGGVDISSLNDNLSLKSDNNIYFSGEIIDVDGVCGGYNLFFAFLCAYKIYEDLK